MKKEAQRWMRQYEQGDRYDNERGGVPGCDGKESVGEAGRKRGGGKEERRTEMDVKIRTLDVVAVDVMERDRRRSTGTKTEKDGGGDEETRTEVDGKIRTKG